MLIQIENGDIYFLDSLGLKINTSLEFQLCKIYGQNKNRILIKIPEVQKQENRIDCGLFAIANAVEFCNNGLHNFLPFSPSHPIISSIVSGLPQLQFIGISRE
jgi:hypothetical protein